MKNNLSLLDRLQLPTSPFFKPLVKAGLLVAMLSAFLVTIQASLTSGGIDAPVWLKTTTIVVGAIGAGIAAAAKLTVDSEAPETIARIRINSLNDVV
ncbi:hypothetical protein [Arsenicibacter rosenii]|uniref:Holin n=1 Tax=Arsenicibacter rosenii TaxID=1750698 RepID=A0A1S2VFY5_9BACT|nr:hypothetical protein [Arsenicibacter rosenii]OIN57624.1 hypothetical protein BLX24_19295 [Arsenicibacter rosenii]